MDYKETLDKLFALHTFGIKLGLENIKNFMEEIGNPQLKLKTFHIAGSNGKGSTSSNIASILTSKGLKVGLYTSPHFIRFNERIRINGVEIPDSYVVSFYNEYEKYIDENKLTFFEVTTAMAFKYFYESNVDYAVIETGLGGRLDATNVLNPSPCIITSISLEHTNVLGNTLQEIALEKAGIIKPGAAVFAGRMPKEALNVIKEVSEKQKAVFYNFEDFFTESTLDVNDNKYDFGTIHLELKGDYQILNASLAILTLEKNGLITNKEEAIKGLSDVILNTGLSGRYEYFNTNPDILFDSAHNIEGIDNFVSEFSKDYLKYKNREVVFTAMRDKAVAGMLERLAPYFHKIHGTTIEYERAMSIEELKIEGEKSGISINRLENAVEYIENFKSEPKENCLVVLGSMYLLGYIKSNILE